MKQESHDLIANNIHQILESSTKSSETPTKIIGGYGLCEVEIQEVLSTIEGASCRAGMYSIGFGSHQFAGGEPSCKIFSGAIKFFEQWHKDNPPEPLRSLEELIEGFNSDDDEKRQASVYKMGEIEDLNAIPYLIKGIEHEDEFTRLYSVQALGEYVDPEIVNALCKRTEIETSKLVLVNILSIFEEVKNESSLEYIFKLASHENPFVRYEVARVLGEIGDQHAIPVLENLSTDQEIPEGVDIDGDPEIEIYSIGDVARDSLNQLKHWWKFW